MYVPHFNAMPDPELADLVAAVGAAELVTVTPSGYPVSTLLPVIWEEERLLFHMARANPHWKDLVSGSPALAVVTGPQAYVSPAWYPAKQEHGRVVPTWNYTAVHFTGRVEVHQDEAWLRDAVTSLTVIHERDRPAPWSVADAPGTYVDKQLRAIVGIELTIERVEGKAKLSQNRPATDQAGVVAGLRREGGTTAQEVARLMEERAPWD
jgi:transcriptional regulator